MENAAQSPRCKADEHRDEGAYVRLRDRAEVEDNTADGVFGRASKLINSKIGGYRFRVSDHRVIFDLVGDDIVVLRVGHRGDIYR